METFRDCDALWEGPIHQNCNDLILCIKHISISHKLANTFVCACWAQYDPSSIYILLFFIPYGFTLINIASRGAWDYSSEARSWFHMKYSFVAETLKLQLQIVAHSWPVSFCLNVKSVIIRPVCQLQIAFAYFCSLMTVFVRCTRVCDCLCFLARSSVDESTESPGDHRSQPAEAVWKLAAQGEWGHTSRENESKSPLSH